jgi:hypothetical protein
MPGRTACQPKIEGFREVSRVPRRDERAGEMHTGRNVRLGEDAGHQGSYGDRGFTLEAFADFGESICAPRPDVRQMCREFCVCRVEVEPDHVQGLTVPAAGHLDPVDVS